MFKFIHLFLKEGAEAPGRHDHVVDLSRYSHGSEPVANGVEEAISAIVSDGKRHDGDLLYNTSTGSWWRLVGNRATRTFPIGEMP